MTRNRQGRSVCAGIVALACATTGCGAGSECARTEPARELAPSGPLAAYAWLAGTWVSLGDDGSRTEETWTLPRGTVMPGVSHTEDAEGQTQFWESVRIEADGEGTRYVARPMGAASETVFRSVATSAGRAVFESPEHDYPQRITYAADGPDVLRATIDDLAGSRPRTWELRRELR